MKHVNQIVIAAITLLIVIPAQHAAAEAFPDAMQQGEALRKEGKHEEAVGSFKEAFRHARNDTERGLALGKQAYVYAFDLEDYEKARPLAKQALALEEAKAVSNVTAMRVIGQCQMKGDKDYDAAAETIAEALSLLGVDWARPSLAMMLGDCYRLSKRPYQAIYAYSTVNLMEGTNDAIKGVAWLNIALTHHYTLRDAEAAKEAYDIAVKLNSGLSEEINGHLKRLAELPAG